MKSSKISANNLFYMLSASVGIIFALYIAYGFHIFSLEENQSSQIRELIKDINSVFTTILSGAITALVALIVFQKGTKKIDHKKELIDFYKKYIDIKNEISKCLIKFEFQEVEKKKDNLQELTFLFIKTINLLFEECLSAKNNELVRRKLRGEDGWLRSTCNELSDILRSIEHIFPLPTSTMHDHFENALQTYFSQKYDPKSTQLEIFFENLLKEPEPNSPKPDFAKEIFKLQQIYHYKFGEVAKTIVIPPSNTIQIEGIGNSFDNLIGLTKQMVISQKSIDDKISTYSRQNPQKKAR